MNHLPLTKTGKEPEYKKNPPLPISSVGTETEKNLTRMPYGSALLTDAGSNKNSLKNKGIIHIIHVAMKPLGIYEAEFLKIAQLAIQNTILLVERKKIDTKLATCFLGGNIYCPREEVKPRLAEVIIQSGLSQLAECSYLQEVIFVDYDGDYYQNALEKIEEADNCPPNIDKVRVVRGDFLKKDLHGASVIVNSENAEMEWGGGVSGNIKSNLGDEASAEVDSQRKKLMNDFNFLIGKDENNDKITAKFQFQGKGSSKDESGDYYLFISQDGKYSLEISKKHSTFTFKPYQRYGKEVNKDLNVYEISWLESEKDKKLFKVSDFVEVKELEREKEELEIVVPPKESVFKKVLNSPLIWLGAAGIILLIYYFFKKLFYAT